MQIPGTEKIEFKEKFVERYSQLTDWEKFKESSLSFLERCVRVNTLKGTVKEVRKNIERKGWKLRQVPWCKEGFWIEGPAGLSSFSGEKFSCPAFIENCRGLIPRTLVRQFSIPKIARLNTPDFSRGISAIFVIDGEDCPPTTPTTHPKLRFLAGGGRGEEEKEEEIVKPRRDVGNLLEHHLGKIYVQEAASMIPPIVLGAREGELVLDMCGAPGSKSTQIAAMMKNKGLLVANDVSGLRLQALGINLQRCGATNVIITLGTGYSFKGFEFDRILVDASCSATGTIMRSLKTVRMWNPGMVRHLSKVQKGLLESGFNNLKERGVLVYSTCTMEPEEDEEVVAWLLEKYDKAEIEEIKEKELPGLKRSEAVLRFGGKEYGSEVKKCLRIWPQDNNTEGFFVARIRKKG